MRCHKDHLAADDQAGARGGDVAADVAGLEFRPRFELKARSTQPCCPGEDGTPGGETRTWNLGWRGQYQIQNEIQFRAFTQFKLMVISMIIMRLRICQLLWPWLKKLLKMFPQMKIESTPSSSSNHVVLQRLTSKTEKRGEDGELPRIGEDDIDNVIGSRNILDRAFYFIIFMFLQLQFGLIYDYFPNWIPGRRNI